VLAKFHYGSAVRLGRGSAERKIFDFESWISVPVLLLSIFCDGRRRYACVLHAKKTGRASRVAGLPGLAARAASYGWPQ